MCVILPPFLDIDFFNPNRLLGASRDAGRLKALRKPAVAHIAFGNDTALGIPLRDPVRAIPAAITAADAFLFLMFHNAVFQFDVGIGGTSREAGGIQAMIAGHRKMETFGLGVHAAFNLSDTAPVDGGRIVVLLVAGHDAALAADTASHVEMKTVLLAFF